jgi:hypothetical protein
MSVAFFIFGPMVIGFTTYSMQNAIYFDLETIIVYFFGDAVLIYIISLLAVSGIENQTHFLSKWAQHKVFG